MYEFKERVEKVGLKTHPGKTKVLSNQSSTSPDSKKNANRRGQKLKSLTRSESVRYSGQLITFQHQETTKSRIVSGQPGRRFHKYRQELTSKNYLLKHRLRLFDAAITPTICMLRIGNMGTHQKAWKNVTVGATQNAPSHHSNTKRYKKIVKHNVNNSEDINDIDSSCTNDESEDGKSDTSHIDQDNDVSFEIDSDEEIDAAEIEEEELLIGAPLKIWKR